MSGVTTSWNAEQDHGGDLDRQRNENLERVEAHAGGDVDVEIGMMHAVQPPQHRHLVEHNVLSINDEIKDQKAQYRGEGGRQPGEMEQPPSALGREQRRAHRRSRNEDAHRDHIEDEDAEIVRPARRAADRPRAPRGHKLPPCHGREDQGKAGDSNQELDVHRRRQMIGRWHTASPVIARADYKA
jgi:hypothetical protein